MNQYWNLQKIDESDRLVLPLDLLESVGLGPGSEYEILVDEDGSIVLQKHASSCSICSGTAQDMIRFRERNVCIGCRDQLVRGRQTAVPSED